jgi:hypothetical protein
MATWGAFDERCRCGHPRNQHADRDNRLQLVPLNMTEADDDADERHRPAVMVHGAGACTVAGCSCRQFTDAPAEEPPTE